MKEYNVGDLVWWAHCGINQVKLGCPVCYGKRAVILTLGNGESVETPCDYCTRGFEGPFGYIHENEWVAAVEQVPIDSKEINEGPKGRSVEYRTSNYIISDGELFSDKAEAEACVRDMIAQHEVELERNIASKKDNNLRKYSWHVGYHGRELKKAQQQVAYHSRKIISMKEMAKQEKRELTTPS